MRNLLASRLWSLVLLLVAPAAAAAQDDVDFIKQVQPLLQKHCYKCHGAKDDKGDLMLHSKEVIDASEVVVAGDPEESELFYRITLPEGDEDLMPKGGKPLAEDEIEIIKLWIEQGAEMPEGEHISVAAEPDVPQVAPASADAVAAIADSGALVMPLAQNDNRLTVGFGSSAAEVGDAEVALLLPVAEQLSWLNLARTKITDEGLAPLAQLQNLTRVHLELTAVGDEGLKHLGGLENLEYLNLYGTQVSDAGIEHLKNLKKLKRLYVWQTPVSYAKAKELEAAIEGLEVNLGHDHPDVVRERLTKEIARATERKEDATAREEQARKEKEAATEQETAARKQLAELEAKLKEQQASENNQAGAPPQPQAAEEEEAEADKPAENEGQGDAEES